MCYPARLFARNSRNLDQVEMLTITFSLNYNETCRYGINERFITVLG